MSQSKYKYLDNISSPEDLKRLSEKELKLFSQELRSFIINELSENPGHLGSSLGTIELTTALHYVYNTPYDRIVWDVGHQAYGHKIITGRRDRFHTNRKLGGLTPFPSMRESEYDSFGAGHSSVSISAAYGMATAAKLKGEQREVVAVIGDGAMTGGLAFEGMNNAGGSETNLLVVLNDNRMSIDPNVGAMKEYLLKITSSKQYNQMKGKAWKFLSPVPRVRHLVKKTSDALKLGILQQSNLFESLNFRYFGPVDGHDLQTLVRTLRDLKHIPGPKLLHVLSVKGKDYEPAERNQSDWHAPGRFNPESGKRLECFDPNKPARYQDVFGETLLELAREDERIVGITPAMPKGCSLNIMMQEMPERCFDVGIAEGHAVTFSAGLAAEGLVPFCNIYSSFVQRAYDNIIHDVALQNLHVIFCLDRAGIVGEDGATHHGVFDIAFLRPIPNMVVASPMDELELRNLMHTALNTKSPFAIRYPRGRGEGVAWRGEPMEMIPVGRGRVLREGNDVALLTLGPLGNVAVAAAERAAAIGVSVYHADLRYAKPLDKELLHDVGKRFKHIITVEDGVVMGGVGSAVSEFMEREGYCVKVDMLGIPDKFIEHGTPAELHKLCGLDEDSIFEKLASFASDKSSGHDNEQSA